MHAIALNEKALIPIVPQKKEKRGKKKKREKKNIEKHTPYCTPP